MKSKCNKVIALSPGPSPLIKNKELKREKMILDTIGDFFSFHYSYFY